MYSFLLFLNNSVISHTSLSDQVNHLRCLHEFVEAQAVYYSQCYKHMQDLQKELSR